jgi:hypothetical protein
MIQHHAGEDAKEWLRNECSQKHSLESLVYELGRPLEPSDEIGRVVDFNLSTVRLIPILFDPQMMRLCSVSVRLRMLQFQSISRQSSMDMNPPRYN